MFVLAWLHAGKQSMWRAKGVECTLSQKYNLGTNQLLSDNDFALYHLFIICLDSEAYNLRVIV